MSKHNHRNKQESNSSNNAVITNQDIEALAFQIHREKGGSELDNWLEAERTLKEKQSH